MLKRLNRLAITGAAIAATLTLFLYIGRTLDPVDYPTIGLIMLGYPVVLVLNLLFIVIGLLCRKRWGFIPLLALLFTWPLQRDFIQFWPADTDDGDYSLLSFNTQLLGFYQFDRNEALREENLMMLDSIGADILCFQEFYKHNKPKGFKTLSLIQEQMGPFETHEKYTHEFVHDQFFGVVTLSKFPIVHRGYIAFDGDINNFCIYSDLVLPNSDTVRVFNAHLASIHFRPADYGFIKGEYANWSAFKQGMMQVSSKLQKADARRSIQIKRVIDEIKQSPYSTIFAGDLNATPFSNAYYRLSENLQDAFVGAGQGISATFKSDLAVLRIDHIFHSDDILVRRYNRTVAGASDHYPVHIKFDFDHE